MELLSAIGLADDITQQCCAVRESAAFDLKDGGREVFGRGWSFLESIARDGDTRWGFASVLRQKYVEGIVRARLEGMGVVVREEAEFVALVVDEEVGVGQVGRVRARVLDKKVDSEYEVSCRYLLGCDGSRTKVRGAAGIESTGDRTEEKWVRIDGVLKSTTMPKPRAYGALESPTYGNVLWIPLDHGATRIGFALNEERRKLYGELTEEVFVKEAKLSVAPFEIEYARVDWASVYSVGQRVAKSFWTKGCVLLAGDACHTHSSGAGQGMNAGVHDAVNLAWKLSLVLQGRAGESLLEKYDSERRPNAERLIRYDEEISVLVTGRLPKGWKGHPDANPNVVLGEILQEAKGFNTGLTIGYGVNMLNVAKDGAPNGEGGSEHEVMTIPAPALPSRRAPEVKLLKPALLEPVWLHQVIPNRARFYIVVFTGDPEQTRGSYQAFQQSVAASSLVLGTSVERNPAANGHKEIETNCAHANGISHARMPPPVDFLTILPGTVANAWHLLGTEPFGRVYYDAKSEAHRRYDVDTRRGAVFVLRPDGWVGATHDLGAAGVVAKIEDYFGVVLLR